MTEDRIKLKLRVYLSSIGAFWSNVQGGRGSKPGDPDIVVCYRGRYIGIESKTPENRLSPVQKDRMMEIINAGGQYWVIRSVDELKKKIEELK